MAAVELEKDDESIIISGHTKRIKTDVEIEPDNYSRFVFRDDIVPEILLRLPIGCLLRFKTVCKQWRDLISGANFVTKHASNKGCNIASYLHTLQFTVEFYKGHVLFDGQSFRKLVKVTSINSEQTEIIARNIDFPSQLRNTYYQGGVAFVLGSCDGVLLLTGESDTTFLWNPSIRQCKTFTHSGSNCFKMYLVHRISGLGYDMSRDEYKGVVIEDNVMIVFSSKTGKWKAVEWNFGYNPYFYGCIPLIGTTLNGVPHWIQRGRFSGDIANSNRIMYFDVADDKLKMLSIPDAPCKSWVTPYMSLLEGCLCLLPCEKDDRNVWVRKEYGVENSWTKLFVLHRSNEIDYVSYNINNINDWKVPYVETLVSP